MELASYALVALTYSAPLLLAGLGELLVERTGLVNLGVEGIVALGAAIAALVGVATGNWAASYLAAGVAGAGLILVYYLLVVVLGAEQIVVGLALFFAGWGLAELAGSMTGGEPATPAPRIWGLDPVTPVSLVLVLAAWLLLYHTWAGYAMRSVGESAESALALGVNVKKMRLYALLAEGFLAGMAGAQILLALYYARWYSGVTTGWGWLSLGVVVLGYWHPLGVLVASLFTGALFSVLQPLLASMGVPPALASSFPYLAVLVALGAMSLLARRLGVSPPASVWRE